MESNEIVSRKRKRFLTKFQENWLKNEMFNNWLSKKDDQTARCDPCSKDITIKYEGINALKKHKESDSHKQKMSAIKMSQSLSTFVVKTSNKESDETAISELCITYHTVYHHLSYRSMDCDVKLIKTLFKDSKICQSLHLGRTKSEMIAQNILCPLSVEIHLNSMQNKRFSIASDASNKGNIKLFPIAIQYFDLKSGIKNFVLDFYEDPNEKSEAIYKHLKTAMSENQLKIDNLIAYTGDNASVNYGINHSVYRSLTDEKANLIKANCNCHVLHNTAKYAMIELPFDIENLILKIYSHFSISAKRVAELKICYDFADNEFEGMKRHVITRWLSLFPAINRLIDSIVPLKSYFIGEGTDQSPPIIREFVWSETHNNTTLCELYLHFSSNFMKLFHITIKTFEQKKVNATNLYDLMFKVKTQLQNRINQKFFGSKVEENLKFFPETERKLFVKNAMNCYQRAINYFNKNFDFDYSPFKLFSKMNLDSPLLFKNVCEISKKLNLDCDFDSLFDEINSFNEILVELEKHKKNLDSISKYCEILSSNDFSNLSKVVESVMAVPVGNDFVERIFSHVKKLWTDQRSQLSIQLIKAEICIKNNFSINCIEFRDFIKENKKCINSVKSSSKYSFITKK